MRASSVIALSFLGCIPALPPAPVTPSQADLGFEDGNAPPLAGVDEDTPRPFVLLPGDVVSLTMISARPLTVSAMRVDNVGHIHVPLGGDVPVLGLSLAAAERAVERALRPIDQYGRALLQLTEAAGHHATVVGAVTSPGRVALLPGTRVADLLALVGGPRQSEVGGRADLEGTRLVREGSPVPVSIPRALAGDPRHNVLVRPSDLLYVPDGAARSIAVIGQITRQGTIAFRRGIRLSEVIARSGGTTRDADDGDVRVIRGPLQHARVYRVRLNDFVDGRASDVELAPGDVIYVSTEWLADMGEVLNRIAPLLAGVQSVRTLAPQP